MRRSSLKILVTALGASLMAALAVADSPSDTTRQTVLSNASSIAELDSLVGQPVDIAPWAFAWRADREVQDKPEAWFIPRRLERIDRVYRTAFYEMPESELKSRSYQMPDLLKPLLPKPKGQLQVGLLWTGRIEDYRVELHWPADTQWIPVPETVEVRAFPTPFGWFGWTKDEVLTREGVSADGHTWTYQRQSNTEIPIHEFIDGKDWYRSGSATEMIAVFYEGKRPNGGCYAVPTVRVLSPRIGVWKRMDVEIEWAFQAGTEQADLDGFAEPFMAIVGPISPLPDDKGTTTIDAHWQSRASGDTRRGIVLPLLYAVNDQPAAPGQQVKGTDGIYNGDGRPALDSQVTVWTATTGFTFRVRDLDDGPILTPQHGVYIAKAGGKPARQFVQELATKNLKSLCQSTREHPEVASWEELMRHVRFAGSSEPETFLPFPEFEDPPMQVELSDARWMNAWRAACAQMRSRSIYEALAWEGARTAHGMDLAGLHDEADKLYQHFLKAPGAKSDGDYTDGKGALEWATGMRHDMGYEQDGNHASTGMLLFSMADRLFLTGDKEWFRRNRARLQAAADWIIRQRASYLKDIPNRQDFLVAGLMPPCMLGDYAMPSCDWHWYYPDNAFALQGLQRFADALAEFDAETAQKYSDQANAFREDLRRAVNLDAVLSPVRLGRDGMYHTFIPIGPYFRGSLMTMELGSLQRPQGDIWCGALPLAEPFVALDANDPRVVETIHVMDEIGSSPKVTAYIMPPSLGWTMNVMEEIKASVKAAWEPNGSQMTGPSSGENWFWNSYGGNLPKGVRTANIFLLQDDVPNFLRMFLNSYALVTGTDGKLWEWGRVGQYANCDGPDNGTAGWFLEQFRNLLVMETDGGQSLWIARATPRAWLEQGKRIAVRNAPTYFGPLAYEIISDVDNGHITAIVEIPKRNPPEDTILRLRHPEAAPIRNVTVNGKRWDDFDPDKEIVRLHCLRGSVRVDVAYR